MPRPEFVCNETCKLDVTNASTEVIAFLTLMAYSSAGLADEFPDKLRDDAGNFLDDKSPNAPSFTQVRFCGQSIGRGDCALFELDRNATRIIKR